MANLKEIRSRIASVASTMQITSAMKMVSAAKLKKAQDAITAMRPYSNKLSELLKNFSTSLEDDSQSKFTQQRPINKVLIVAITSNRGLCGAFNANVIKEVRSLSESKYAGKQVSLLCIGKKGYDVLRKGHSIWEKNVEVFDNLTFEAIAPIAERLMSAHENKDFDQIVLVYNNFKNAANQLVITEQYLPIIPPERDSTLQIDYIFEPDKAEIVNVLIPKSLKTQLYKAVRDSFAAEHGARMTAMHKATDNAKELKSQLVLNYNKARQAAITNEILEIVSGAEALNG